MRRRWHNSSRPTHPGNNRLIKVNGGLFSVPLGGVTDDERGINGGGIAWLGTSIKGRKGDNRGHGGGNGRQRW